MPEKTVEEIPPNIKSFYERARDSLEQGKYDLAITLFQSVLNAEPGFLKARQFLRVTQLKKFKAGGKTSLKKFTTMFTGAGHMAKGSMSASKNPVETMAQAEKILNEDPTSAQALNMLAKAAEDAEFYQTAGWTLETLYEQNPKDVDHLRRMAEFYMREEVHDTEKAREVYERILKLRPNDGDALRGIKNAAAMGSIKGGWEEAKSYRDIIKDKAVAVSLEQASRVMKSDDILANQINDILAALQREPDNLVLVRKLGDLYTQKNEFDQALTYLNIALERTGGDSSLDSAIADTSRRKFEFQIEAKKAEYAQSGSPAVQAQIEELEKAKAQFQIEDCERRRDRYPNDLDIRFEMGQLYMRAGRIDEAIKEFQLAQRNPKRRIPTLNFIGQCFAQKGILDLAADQFKKAISEYPLFDGLKKDIHYNLGLVFERMKKDELAVDQFKKIYEADLGYRDVAQKIEAYYRRQAEKSAAEM